MGPKSRIRRTIRSDALKVNNAIDLKSKSKVNEILHEVVDNNNNSHQSHHQKSVSKNEKKLSNQKRDSNKNKETEAVSVTNGDHSKIEWYRQKSITARKH